MDWFQVWDNTCLMSKIFHFISEARLVCWMSPHIFSHRLQEYYTLSVILLTSKHENNIPRKEEKHTSTRKITHEFRRWAYSELIRHGTAEATSAFMTADVSWHGGHHVIVHDGRCGMARRRPRHRSWRQMWHSTAASAKHGVEVPLYD